MTLTSYFRQLALLIRLPNSFTIVSNVLAAYTIGAGNRVDISSLLVLTLASLCFYHGGIVLNDCMDVEEDRRTQPERPIARGDFVLSFAWPLAISLMVVGLLILLPFGKHTVLAGMALLLCIVAYNYSSRQGLIGCLLMGLCRSLNWLLTLAALGVVKEYGHYAFIVGIYVTSFTFLSRDENYAQKKWLVGLGAIFLFIGGAVLLSVIEPHSDHYILKVSILFICLMLAFGRILWLFKNYTEENIRATVMYFILGMIPLDACLVFVAGYPVTAILVLALVVPGKILARYLYVT